MLYLARSGEQDLAAATVFLLKVSSGAARVILLITSTSVRALLTLFQAVVVTLRRQI